MPKHNKFLFKKRIHVHILMLLLAATTSPALENNHFTSLGKQSLWRHRCFTCSR